MRFVPGSCNEAGKDIQRSRMGDRETESEVYVDDDREAEWQRQREGREW